MLLCVAYLIYIINYYLFLGMGSYTSTAKEKEKGFIIM